MIRWYADDNYARLNKDEKPRIFLLGGILLPDDAESNLRKRFKEIKGQLTHPNLPVKWNIKDKSVKEIYERFNKLDELNQLKQKSKEWRRDVFTALNECNCKLFFSCIENFQADKKMQKPIKENLTSFLFANSLMRVGIFVRDNRFSNIEVVLDWPADSNPKPFNDEYYRAYNSGCSVDGVEYFCGPLSKLGFHESVLFTKCTHSSMLQITDLLLGALKDFIESHLFGNGLFGRELIEMVIPKLYGYPENIIGRGINISSRNKDLEQTMKDVFKNYLA
jgi:hypothetical protein